MTSDSKAKGAWAIPPELADLELYAADQKLCTAWEGLIRAWRQSFPRMNILAEVRKAHAWEVANPERRKRRRGAYLNGWISRSHQDRSDRGRLEPTTGATAADIVSQKCELCKGQSFVYESTGTFPEGDGPMIKCPRGC